MYFFSFPRNITCTIFECFYYVRTVPQKVQMSSIPLCTLIVKNNHWYKFVFYSLQHFPGIFQILKFCFTLLPFLVISLKILGAFIVPNYISNQIQQCFFKLKQNWQRKNQIEDIWKKWENVLSHSNIPCTKFTSFYKLILFLSLFRWISWCKIQRWIEAKTRFY